VKTLYSSEDGNGLQEVVLVIKSGQIQQSGRDDGGRSDVSVPELLQEELLTGKGFSEGHAEAVKGCRGAGWFGNAICQ